jgi:hypothetical protein
MLCTVSGFWTWLPILILMSLYTDDVLPSNWQLMLLTERMGEGFFIIIIIINKCYTSENMPAWWYRAYVPGNNNSWDYWLTEHERIGRLFWFIFAAIRKTFIFMLKGAFVWTFRVFFFYKKNTDSSFRLPLQICNDLIAWLWKWREK